MQEWNAEDVPILTTLLGMVTDVNEKQPWNAKVPM